MPLCFAKGYKNYINLIDKQFLQLTADVVRSPERLVEVYSGIVVTFHCKNLKLRIGQ
jgi:Flp pilus assembly CpaE family ATPase